MSKNSETLPLPEHRFDDAAVIERLPAMRLVGSPRSAVILARLLAVSFFVAVLGMVLLPWQQTAVGSGRIVAYDPLKREQTLEAPVAGIVRKWHVQREGQEVKAGQPIVEIWDNDPELLQRLAEQVQAVREKVSLAERKAESYGLQVSQYVQVRESAIRKAREDVAAAGQKVQAADAGVRAAEAAFWQEEQNFHRQRSLAEEGLVATLSVEIQTRKYREAKEKLEAARNYTEVAKREEAAKKAELDKVDFETQAKIESSRAEHQSAQGDVAIARKELLELETKLAQQQQVVRAPHDGYVLRLRVNLNGEMVKQGDPLVDIVPISEERAVELWIDGNDVPLVSRGRHVRLLFEGWPGVQFAGWPSVAVGTFGGKVVAIDASDNGKGQFRVLVRPDGQEPWPEQRFLRQGVRASGWVLLNRVTLGWEIWRQLNGFPPVLTTDEPKDQSPTLVKTKRK